jgi:hypothetical protein
MTMLGVCIPKTVVNTKDIKKLQNNIIVMISQVMDFKPTRQETVQMLEGLIQILSSSEERLRLM